MKIRIVWIVFFVAIVSLFAFQVVWLYNTFHIKKVDIEHNINYLLSLSIEQELEFRQNKYLSNEELRYVSLDVADTIQSSVDEVLNKEENVYQQILSLIDKTIDIRMLDSIFQQNLKEEKLSVDYFLVYKDSTGTILEQIGNLLSSKGDEAFLTDALLIVDGKRMQAMVDISPFAIFRQMIWLLIVSFLMLGILVFCVFYQARSVITQYKLNQLREDFTHALTHNMKTPLSTINNVLSQFRSGSLDNHPEMKERFGKIGMEQVAGLQMLVEKILTIAKLEQGKLLLERSDTNLPGIVKELKDRFISSGGKQITIRSSFELDDCWICLDPTLIRDAIGNLIENAVKYSGESVVIDVDCYVMNNQLLISVRDNGFGISQKDQQKIFEKFERGAAVSRKGAKGFGLGLNYVKRVTEAHGGVITLYSAENRGSEFILVLPLDDA